MDNCSKNKEIWKDVNGYEGMYQVSSFGNVRSIDREVPFRGGMRFIKGSPLTKWVNGDGYERVSFCVKGKNKHFLVSRLVAEAFIPNPNQKEEVNHLDYNPKNNTVSNLEWCTRSENWEYSRENIMAVLTNPRDYDAKKGKGGGRRCKPVIGTNVETGQKIELDSAKQGKDFGFDPPAITNCLKGNYKQTKGYTWKYK